MCRFLAEMLARLRVRRSLSVDVLQPATLSIQWYPGHMAQARRALAKAFPSQDVIIELLDARMPYASSNPIVTALRKHKPCIKILSKSDLADPEVTKAWVRYLETAVVPSRSAVPAGRVAVITSSEDRFARTKTRIPELCQQLAGRVSTVARPVKAMIVGIPNVGKSTLINVLLGRKVAKVGDEPAVTKRLQQVSLPNGIFLSDNPGLLWPNISDPSVGSKLAFGGAISEAALDYEAVAQFGAGLLLERYPQLMAARYKIKELPKTGVELLAEIGRRRGCLRSGNVVDLHKAADVLIHDFRNGVIGPISLETPADALAALAQIESERAGSPSADILDTDENVDDPADPIDDGSDPDGAAASLAGDDDALMSLTRDGDTD